MPSRDAHHVQRLRGYDRSTSPVTAWSLSFAMGVARPRSRDATQALSRKLVIGGTVGSSLLPSAHARPRSDRLGFTRCPMKLRSSV